MTRKPKTSQRDPYQKRLCRGWEELSPPRPAFPPTGSPHLTPHPMPLSLLHPFSPFTTQKTQDLQAASKALSGEWKNGLFLQLPRAGPASPLSAVPTPSHLLLPQARLLNLQFPRNFMNAQHKPK